MKTTDKINFLNKDCKTNWEIRFHGDYVDINYPDSPVTPDYEDYKSLDMALDEVIKDLLAQKEDRKECKHKWVWNNKLMTNVCSKCNKEPPCPTCGITHTPSPLELPKIHNNFSSIEQYNWAKQVTDKVNKLYQYTKEKKL